MEDRSYVVFIVAIIFFAIAWVAVGLRVFVRAGMLKTFGLDDWLMILTLACYTAYLLCQIGGVKYGTGRHIYDLDPQHARKALRFWYFCELFYILSSCWLKISIGVFLARIAEKRAHMWIIRLTCAGTGIFSLGYFLLALLQCRPISDFWDIGPGAETCVDVNVVVIATYAASGINSFADWTFGILPIFIVWDLEMSRRQKILVAGLLAFAAIGSTATILRIPSIKGLGETHDFLWNTVGISVWSTVEPGIGIAAGCFATLRPLLRSILSRSCFGWRSTIPKSSPSYNLGTSEHLTTKPTRTRFRQSSVIRLGSELRGDRGDKSVGNTTTVTSSRNSPRHSFGMWGSANKSKQLTIHKDITFESYSEWERDLDMLHRQTTRMSSSMEVRKDMSFV